jgi:hypothetical protein
MVLPGYLKQFTVAYYLQALVPHAMPTTGRRACCRGCAILTLGLGTGLVASYLGLPVSCCRVPPAPPNSSTCLRTPRWSPTPMCVT